MGLRDRAVDYLRSIFGQDRDERESALSPSAEAEKHIPSSMFSVWGREDVGGLLSVSQNLMDRYADYEAMNDYPDINCVSGGSLIYVMEGSIAKPVPIEHLAYDNAYVNILAYDTEKKRTTKVMSDHPRLTGLEAPVIKLSFENGSTLRVTKNHKILTSTGYVDAQDLKIGQEVVSMHPGFSTNNTNIITHNVASTTKLLSSTPDGVSKVFDITTTTHNFVVNGIICHNSAYHYFADDATQPDVDHGKTIWVYSKDEAIRNLADSVIRRRLRLEEEIWSIAYNLVLYGNSFQELLVNNNGLVGLNHLPAPTMRRIERGDGALMGFVQDVTGKFTEDANNLRNLLAGKGKLPDHVAVFDDWQVVHMRLRGTHRRCSNGIGVADAARWIWKRLVLLEDSVLIHRLTRAPSRLAFYLDVTDVPSDKVEGFLRKAKMELKKKSLINPKTQKIDMRYNVLGNDEDFIFASRDGKNLGRVETLAGPIYSYVEDIDYFKRMLHGVLKVPRVYLGQDAPAQDKGMLSQSDSRSARVTMGVQRELRNGISRMIRVDQASRGIDPWKTDFEVRMTVPSNLYELTQMELKNARADFATRLLPFVSMNWVRRHVFKLNDEEIEVIESQSKKDVERQLDMQLTQQKKMSEFQMQQQQAQQQALAQTQGAIESPEAPAPMMPVNDLPRTSLEWKLYDASKRLEEKREKETTKKLSELEDKLGRILATDKQFARKLARRQDFLNDFRDAAMPKNGVAHAPIGRGHVS